MGQAHAQTHCCVNARRASQVAATGDYTDKDESGLKVKNRTKVDAGQNAIDMQQSGQWLAMSGIEGSATVVSIEDTGKLINMNPVVRLSLKVTPTMGMPAFDTVGETMVSKIAIPRKGDTIKIKYNPADPKQFVVVS